jgi:hypothetical protein
VSGLGAEDQVVVLPHLTCLLGLCCWRYPWRISDHAVSLERVPELRHLIPVLCVICLRGPAADMLVFHAPNEPSPARIVNAVNARRPSEFLKHLEHLISVKTRS